MLRTLSVLCPALCALGMLMLVSKVLGFGMDVFKHVLLPLAR
jgi:hypothetical protein